MYSLNIISCASVGEFFFVFLKVVLCRLYKKSKKIYKTLCDFYKIVSNIYNGLQLAEGHLLDMGVTMKGYPAVIVAPCFWSNMGQPVTSLTGVHI